MTGFSREARHHEIGGNPDNQHTEGAGGEEYEPGKKQDVKGSSDFIARMFPLAEPELENVPQASQRPVKARITLRPEERHQPLEHNVGETCEAENMNDEEERS